MINNRTLNNADWVSGTAVLDLPASDYPLRVRRTAAGMDLYHVRLLEVLTLSPPNQARFFCARTLHRHF